MSIITLLPFYFKNKFLYSFSSFIIHYNLDSKYKNTIYLSFELNDKRNGKFENLVEKKEKGTKIESSETCA